MKKFVFLAILFNLFFIVFIEISHGFEVKGLQPVAPYSIFSTFSAESLPEGKFAFGVGAERSRQPDFYRFILQFAYGITDRIEFISTIPYVDEWEETKSGMEDIAIGVKHRILDEGKYSPSMAYIINASLPSGGSEFTTDGRAGIGIVASKRVGPVSGHANIFYEKAGSSRIEDEMIFSAGFNFSAAHNFKILGEIYGRKITSADELSQLEGRFGYRFNTGDYLFTTIGAGFDFKNRTPEYRLLFSITTLLPITKKEIKKIYEEEK